MGKSIVIAMSLLLAACAGYGGHGLVPGQSPLDEVIAVMGQPAMRWAEADGSIRLAYPRGPMGVHTYMVLIGSNGVLRQIENVMDPQAFARIQSGMSQDQVLRTLGPPEPSWTIYFKARDELVWEWRYCDEWNRLARFDVLFDGTTGIVRSTMSQREYCGPNNACWCQR
jgi:hypothetical protein